MELYCYYDRVTGAYSRYFTAVNAEDAIRITRVMLRESPFILDIDLFDVATIDEKTGEVNGMRGKTFICAVSSIFNSEVSE